MKHLARAVCRIGFCLICLLYPLDSKAFPASHGSQASPSLTKTETKPLILWHTQDKDQALFLKKLIGEFSAQHGIPVQLETGMELVASLVTKVEEKNAPEAVLAPSDIIGLADKLNISLIPQNLHTSDISPESWNTAKMDGKVFGIPVLGGNHLILLFNRRTVPSTPGSWEDFVARAAEASAGSPPAPKKPLVGIDYINPYVFLSFVLTFGGSPLQNDKVTLDTPECRKALEYYKNLADKNVVSPSCDYDCPAERFHRGEFAYAVTGDWGWSHARTALGNAFGAARLPTVGGRPMISYSGTHVLFFPGNSLQGPRGKELSALARFFQSRDVQMRWYKEAGRIPVHTAVIKELVNGSDSDTRALLQQLAVAKPMPLSRNMAYVWPAVARGLRLFLAGGKDAAGSCRIMQDLASAQARTKAKP